MTQQEYTTITRVLKTIEDRVKRGYPPKKTYDYSTGQEVEDERYTKELDEHWAAQDPESKLRYEMFLKEYNTQLTSEIKVGSVVKHIERPELDEGIVIYVHHGGESYDVKFPYSTKHLHKLLIEVHK
jgi:hypothetical protein